ncbi:hypothetical protein [Olsenella phocaeensis]|uniref:hypothetical protein n=1 Tax=Olsenella phocaeensis TaxID=1852385 RepID=UPI00101AE05D|nr:hypothetical protein [Olsenella phocaeensis]
MNPLADHALLAVARADGKRELAALSRVDLRVVVLCAEVLGLGRVEAQDLAVLLRAGDAQPQPASRPGEVGAGL